jgi:hypothetical protein
VTLSGQAQPGSDMIVRLNGQNQVGMVKVDQNGRYSLTFKVPLGARPGDAYVVAGCNNCVNGWSTFGGLTINAPSQPTNLSKPSPARPAGRIPARSPSLPTGAFNPANAKPGDSVTLSGQAKPGSYMSAYLNGRTHLGVAKVDQNGRYSLTFNIPTSTDPGSAYVAAGCDSCGNGWNTFSGLTVYQKSRR